MTTLLKTLAIMIVASVIVAAPGLAQSSHGLVLHMFGPSYSGCDELDEGQITCEDIDIEGDGSTVQLVYVLVFGVNATTVPGWVDGIGGVQWGITYDNAAVNMLGWVLCTGGLESPMEEPIAWPAPNTGNAVSWSGGCYESPDEFWVVGYFTVDVGAGGLMFIQGDPRILGDEQYPDGTAMIDCQQTFFALDALDAYSSASMDGPNVQARKSCSMPVPIQETTWGQLKSGYSD